MVNHIVTWCFKEEVSEGTRSKLALDMKKNLEGLISKVPGLLTLNFESNLLDSSTHDLALFTTLESKEALVSYQNHPEHCRVAEEFIKPFVCKRVCIDYEV